ncbi:MAG TPA: choice-of-anchor tandem repeat GloVer-containing protein [Candidatus Sulfotelmatobacter sp.]|nr:choice-of-anchor tandem repeat GloVer-containing protein [Candidatus Sulfotelmatobacter sp.]
MTLSRRTLHSSILKSSFFTTITATGVLLVVAVVFASSALAAERVIYAFKGGSDGIGSNALIADRAGNLFGTTFNGGGSSGAGTVYELSPPAQLGGAWTETILYSFSYAALGNGIGPLAGLVMDAAGNLYGTTWLGGPQGAGVAFELSPSTAPGGSWTYSLLYGFGGAGLSSPEARMVLDKAGNLYGTTVSGGTGGCAGGCGGVFKLAPPTQLGGSWTETVLFNFSGTFETGGGTSAGLTMDAHGVLYGTTFRGSGSTSGTVFRLTPPKTGTRWTHTVLYAFAGLADGSDPEAELVFDKNGNLYGTTSDGGSGGANCFGSPCGTIFQLTPTASGAWTHAVLYSFNGGNDGGFGYPGSALRMDAAGNLYGTTPIGGDPSCGGSGTGCGTVFQLAPPVALGGSWTETVLYRFPGGAAGAGPGGLTFGKGHQLYGPAGAGANNDGLLFSITP